MSRVMYHRQNVGRSNETTSLKNGQRRDTFRLGNEWRRPVLLNLFTAILICSRTDLHGRLNKLVTPSPSNDWPRGWKKFIRESRRRIAGTHATTNVFPSALPANVMYKSEGKGFLSPRASLEWIYRLLNANACRLVSSKQKCLTLDNRPPFFSQQVVRN